MNNSISNDLVDEELLEISLKLQELVSRNKNIKSEIKYLKKIFNDRLQARKRHFEDKLKNDVIIKSSEQLKGIRINDVYKKIGLLSYIEEFTLNIPSKISTPDTFF